MRWLHLRSIPSHFHLFPLCRVSGWIRRVGGQRINFPIRVHLKSTGLFLKVSGLMLWGCLTAQAPLWLYAASADFELAFACH